MDRQVKITTTEARQASPRRMNLRVLVGSMILAIVAGGMLYAAFGPQLQSVSGEQGQQAPAK